MQRQKLHSLMLALSLLSTPSFADHVVPNVVTNISWDWQSGIASRHFRTTPLFANTAQQSQWQSLFALDISHNEWRGTLDIRDTFWLSGNDTSEPARHRSQVRLTSVYWQHSMSQTSDWEVTLGKLQLDWGVGYGYRPLNIFSNYQRHPVGIQIEQGASIAMLTQFVDDGSWQWLVTRSHYSSLSPEQTQTGMGVRRYWLNGDNEWQALLYWDKQRHWNVGGSWVTVLGDRWELHSSMLYQQHYQQVTYAENQPPSAAELQPQRHSLQALIGFTWATSNGVQLIGEYWFDSRSWRASQWHNTLASIRQRQSDASQALTAFPQSLAKQNMPLSAIGHSYARAFNQHNIMRRSMLLHIGLNQTFWQQWAANLAPISANIDLLFGPADGSLVITPRGNYQLIDSNQFSVNLSLSWRYFAGRDNSAFANLQDKSMTWLGFTGRF